MKEKIEFEIKRLIAQKESIENGIENDIRLSLIETGAWTETLYKIKGKIEALEWCLELFE